MLRGAYRKTFRLELQRQLTYRWNVWMEMASVLTISFFALLVWRHISGGEGVGAFSEGQLLSYLVFSGMFVAVLHTPGSADETSRMIKDGDLSSELTRPWNVRWMFFWWAIAKRLVVAIGAFVGYGLVAFGFGVPVWEFISLVGIALVLPFLGIAIIIEHLLFQAVATLAFWLDQTWGLRLFLRVLIELGVGALVPLPLLHPAVRSLFEWSPFRFLGDVMTQILLGTVTGKEIAMLLILGMGWCLALWGFSEWIWRRGIRSYSAIGN